MSDDEIYVRKDVYEAENDHIATAINDTRDMIENVDRHVNRSLTFWGITIAVIAFLFAGMQIGLAIFLYILTTGGLQ